MKTQIYLFRYFYDNAWWSLEIPAYSKEDAEKRVACLTDAKYDGVLELEIEVPVSN